jgi:hypothetical protein
VRDADLKAFHILRILDPARGIGWLLFTHTLLLLYPLAAWRDDQPDMRSHGLAVTVQEEGQII